MPIDFSSLNVWISSAGMPSGVGTGTTPQSTLSPYTATAHGPTVAIAAKPSAKASPVCSSRGASPSSYIVRQRFAAPKPSSEANVASPSSTSCFPLAAMYMG